MIRVGDTVAVNLPRYANCVAEVVHTFTQPQHIAEKLRGPGADGRMAILNVWTKDGWTQVLLAQSLLTRRAS